MSRTIRVGLPGRTATDEMVDRLLAALSGGRRYGAKVMSVRRRWVILLVAAAAAGCTVGGSRAPSPAPTSPPLPASTVTWTDCRLPSDPGALVRAVAAGGDSMPWTAVGQEGGTGSSDPVRPAVWTSPDGCAWRRAAVAPVTPAQQLLGVAEEIPLVLATPTPTPRFARRASQSALRGQYTGLFSAPMSAPTRLSLGSLTIEQ